MTSVEHRPFELNEHHSLTVQFDFYCCVLLSESVTCQDFLRSDVSVRRFRLNFLNIKLSTLFDQQPDGLFGNPLIRMILSDPVPKFGPFRSYILIDEIDPTHNFSAFTFDQVKERSALPLFL